jgi:hypothetical protein
MLWYYKVLGLGLCVSRLEVCVSRLERPIITLCIDVDGTPFLHSYGGGPYTYSDYPLAMSISGFSHGFRHEDGVMQCLATLLVFVYLQGFHTLQHAEQSKMQATRN